MSVDTQLTPIETEFVDKLENEYKILQDKIDKIGAFRFTIKGWSITVILAASFASARPALQRFSAARTVKSREQANARTDRIAAGWSAIRTELSFSADTFRPGLNLFTDPALYR